MVPPGLRTINYLRVSTSKQGHSGLGLAAQRAAIDTYAAQRGFHALQTFTEIESGKNNARPELVKALHRAKVTGATVVIAKLDRLSRDAAFLLTLQNSKVKFVAADMPDANDLTVGIMALVAQQERTAISNRTREALTAAKKRGQRLGNPNGAAALRRAGKGNAAAVSAIKAAADDHAQNLAQTISELRGKGITSLGKIADELNDQGCLTPRGGQWYKASVKNLLARLA